MSGALDSGDGSPDSKEHSKRGLWHSLTLLAENPDLFKAVMACGFLASATVMSPVTPMVLVQLRSLFWQEHMSAYCAMSNSANGIVAMIFSGFFGRFGDAIDRRAAMHLVGIIGFMPSWALLVLGQTSVGLNTYTILLVVGGVACITVTGCPTCYALVSDVIPPGQREVAFGCCFAAVVFVAIISNIGALMVSSLCLGDAQAILLYNLVLQAFFFVCVAAIKLPRDKSQGEIDGELDKESVRELGVSDHTEAGLRSVIGHSDAEKATVADIPFQPVVSMESRERVHLELSLTGMVSVSHRDEEPLDIGTRMPSAGSLAESGRGDVCESSTGFARQGSKIRAPRWRTCIAPILLVRDHQVLRLLCCVAALVCLPEVTLTDISAQYALNQFGLIDSMNDEMVKEVTLLFQWPGFVVLLPAFFLAGILAQRIGALRALHVLIPLSGVLLSAPVFLRLVPTMWIVPFVGMTVPLSMVVFAPLQTLIAQVAPPGRVGEAMGSVGAAKQVASLLSNLMVSFLVPVLVTSGWEKPLWIFYPLATSSSLLALCFACRVKVTDVADFTATASEEEDARPVQFVSHRSCKTITVPPDDSADHA